MADLSQYMVCLGVNPISMVRSTRASTSIRISSIRCKAWQSDSSSRLGQLPGRSGDLPDTQGAAPSVVPTAFCRVAFDRSIYVRKSPWPQGQPDSPRAELVRLKVDLIV